MNRPINSGKRADGGDRVDRFSVELSRFVCKFVRLDRFQGLWLIRNIDVIHKTGSST